MRFRRCDLQPRLGLIVFFACAAASCTNTGTSLLVQVVFDDKLGLTQLQFSGLPDQAPGFGPIRKPDSPGLPLSSGQTVRIRFPDSYAGKSISLDVDGLVEGRVVVASQLRAVLSRDHATSITLDLTPGNVDGGARIDGGSGCADCQSGCCAGSRCYPQPSLSLCGTDGGLCTVCNRQFADNCSNGSCRCGTKDPCTDGQECDGGVCMCTANSCPTGCCIGRTVTCRYYPTDQDAMHCGNAGVECARCSCSGGCSPPPQCLTGGVCDACANQCQSGCCSGNTCSPGNSMTSCGRNGYACAVCDPVTADNCLQGSCACGTGPPCALPGQRCAAIGDGQFQCICDPQLCSAGCCVDGLWCQNGTTEDACGSGGSVCDVCYPPYRCAAQRCQPPLP